MGQKNLHTSFCERIRETHEDADAFLAAISSEPYLSVRINGKKWADGNLEDLGEKVPWCENSYYLNDRPTFTLNPAFHAGSFYVQEASSMSYSMAINAIKDYLPPHPTCLDLCASPGGKTTLILSMLGDKSVVVANEYVRQRAWILRENVAKWGYPSAIVTNRAPIDFATCGTKFDLIAVDAPCSGEGMFRKDDTAVSEWTPQAAEDCATRQRSILDDVWPALKVGGYMIYSTCTFNPEENGKNVHWIADELGAEILTIPMPENVGITTIPIGEGEGYAFYPHKVKGEGFFVSLLKKTDDRYQIDTNSGKGKKRGAGKSEMKETELGRKYVSGCKTYIYENEVSAFPADRAATMKALTETLSPIWAGVPVCSVLTKRGENTISPQPELPLSLNYVRESMPSVELDRQMALKFLHGDTDIPLQELPDGWIAIYYGKLGLGVIKKIGNRINNYYPKEWRIRMNVG